MYLNLPDFNLVGLLNIGKLRSVCVALDIDFDNYYYWTINFNLNNVSHNNNNIIIMIECRRHACHIRCFNAINFDSPCCVCMCTFDQCNINTFLGNYLIIIEPMWAACYFVLDTWLAMHAPAWLKCPDVQLHVHMHCIILNFIFFYGFVIIIMICTATHY